METVKISPKLQHDSLNYFMKIIQVLTGIAAFFIVSKINDIDQRFADLQIRQEKLEMRVSAVERSQVKDEERHNEKMRMLQTILENQQKQQIEIGKLHQQVIDLVIMNPSLKTEKRGG